MGEILDPQSWKELQEAREQFRALLERPTKEAVWQRFFTDYPYVLSRSLPLRLEPREIIPMGRPGKTEPDFIFYQKYRERVTACGVIELKRPDSNIHASRRKGLIQLSHDAYTALNQAQSYAETHILQNQNAIFIGNRIHLFIIMGLSEELSDMAVREVLQNKLPLNCTLFPYDEILKNFEDSLPEHLHVLVNDQSIGSPSEITIPLPGLSPRDKPLIMVRIPAGEFMMGSPEKEKDRYENEGPQHRVVIANDFYMGKYPITQAQWRVLMGENPSEFKDKPNNPVEKISWNDCQEFIKKINLLGQEYVFRLPTEAEWEYACRAGTISRFYWGDDPDYSLIKDYAWYNGNNNPNGTKEVGLKHPNSWGLYEMSGDVWVWCEDEWHDNYVGAPEDGREWIDIDKNSLSARVLRGGSCYNEPRICRSAFRSGFGPHNRFNDVGFRIVSSRI